MRITVLGLLVLATTMAGCAMTYQPAPYEENLWQMARAHGHRQVFHTHIIGYGTCAAVLVSGVGTNRFSAETNAYRSGQKFFNPSIGNVPIFGEMIISEREVITIKKRVLKINDDDWRVESIVISPLSNNYH